jgi:hypothetical protein
MSYLSMVSFAVLVELGKGGGGGGTREDQCPSIAEAAGLDSEAGYSYSSSAILTSNNSDSSSEKGGETHEKNDF